MQPAERLDKATARERNPPAGEPVAHDDEAHEHGLDAMELDHCGRSIRSSSTR